MRFTRWDQVATSEATDAFVTTLALKHLEGVCHPSRDVLATAIRGRDYGTLCSYEPDYADLSAEDARNIRQALGFFTKRSDASIPGVDKRKVAQAKFMEAEALCLDTNRRIRQSRAGEYRFSPDVAVVQYHAQRLIAEILGRVPLMSELRPVFGPGATTTTTRRDASPRSKLGGALACSEELRPIARCCLAELQGWVKDPNLAERNLAVMPGKLSFVPKSAKTDRTVLVEPVLNGMFQMALGRHIADRLRRRGVDITDQTRNQTLAWLGSVNGALATLDLSSASDTIAKELVYDLLPIDWAHHLSRFRTGTAKLPGGQLLRLEKFSSMGNGFTFPLETLIFYAIAWGACMVTHAWREVDFLASLSVYGDDIIVPTKSYALLVESLQALGFIPNKDKSFSSGPFRESCGKDYFSGIDIRPFYLKGPLSGELVFVLHNYYVRTGRPEFGAIVLGWLDATLHLFGPDGYGDGHLIGDHPRPLKPKLKARGFCGYTFDAFVWKSRKSYRSYQNEHVLPSYTIYASPPPNKLWVPRTSSYLGRSRRVSLDISSKKGSFGYERGELWYTVPQTDGYKRISIYVLD